MNDLAYYASDIVEGIINLIGVGLFFIFVLPPFLVIFIPLLILSSSLIVCGIGLYLTYVVLGVCWELTRNTVRWLWLGSTVTERKQRRRDSLYKRGEVLALVDLPELDQERRLSGALTPRRIAQPRSRSGSIHLKKSDSLRSLVGPSSDHDFEDTGGWANSKEDDEAMYMARTLGVQDAESIYSPVLYHSESPYGHHSPQGVRTPASSRPVSRGETWRLGPGGAGAATPKAPRSGTVTPESYFSLPMTGGKAFATNLDPVLPTTAATQYAIHRKNS